MPGWGEPPRIGEGMGPMGHVTHHVSHGMSVNRSYNTRDTVVRLAQVGS